MNDSHDGSEDAHLEPIMSQGGYDMDGGIVTQPEKLQFLIFVKI